MPKNFYKYGFLVLLFLIAVGATFYIGRNLTQKPQTDEKQITPTIVEEEVVIDEEITVLDRENVEENIEAGIKTGDYAAIGSYMVDEVFVALYATECCGPQDREEAVNNLGYIKSGENWNFDQENQVAKDLKAKSEYFGPDSFVGVASNEYAIAFKFNEENRISDVAMVASYKLITDQ